MKKCIVLSIILTIFTTALSAQKFERKDSLQGTITKERAWWNLVHYDIEVNIDINSKFISGKNTIQYEVLESDSIIQIDLQSPMKLTLARQNGSFLTYKREYGAYFIKLPDVQEKGSTQEITIAFEGNPVESMNPPWDGGFVWKKDKNQNPFIANANQSIGVSAWLPSKDIPYDEPDLGMDIRISSPENVISVSNGRLLETTKNPDGTKTFYWKVENPINGYSINMNLADYVHFNDVFEGEKGPLDLDFYVLSYNLEKAKKQFKQVPKMLEAFEHWFGPYPFYNDGYKLVEVPYLGMEHQSSVTYGNNYENGYLGSDLSDTGEGLKFDFIIIHESGHEWFANSITNYDIADMWIHESFTTYSEVLYLDYHFGKASGNSYLKGFRERAINLSPIIGIYGVNKRGSGDMYIKGAAMIHTLRQIMDDDEKFRELLRAINKEYYHQTVSSATLEKFIMDYTNLELSGFFDQYLRNIKIPVLQFKINNGVLKYRFRNTVDNFQIPLKTTINDEVVWLKPTKKWQTYASEAKVSQFNLDDNFYVYLRN
ncbi:M1 family metallopeptidase [Lutimonas sp.]|uniref:M1 family metallopeptidase n=1 Tax=Lutimonas sp. TaxID=1872403 RepID=UPI003D9B748A